MEKNNRTKLLLPIDVSSSSVVNQVETASQETGTNGGYVITPFGKVATADLKNGDCSLNAAICKEDQRPPPFLSSSSSIMTVSEDALPVKPSLKHLRFDKSSADLNQRTVTPMNGVSLIASHDSYLQSPTINITEMKIHDSDPRRMTAWLLTESLLKKTVETRLVYEKTNPV